MRSRLIATWDRFWFRPAGPFGLIAARAIVSLNALWIVLSRPDLPGVLGWPPGFWISASRGLASRFLVLGLPLAVERALYGILVLALVAALFGLWPRVACLTAALLLYHFAPFADLFFWLPGPYFRGLTLPLLALLLLSFAEAPRPSAAPSPEWRWPLAAIQVCFAATYLLSGLSKLVSVGPVWATARNFEGLVLGMMFPEVTPPWAHVFVGRTWLCWLGAAAGVFMDFGVPIALFSAKAARWILPAIFLGHLAIVPIFGIFFLALPGLLLFVDWDALVARWRAKWAPQPTRAARSRPSPTRSPAP